MERLDTKDYNRARDCLKQFNYNCINIINIQSDILSLSISPVDGMPKTPYMVGNSTLQKVIRLEEDEELQKCVKEYKAVVQALQLVDKISKEIFEEEFRKSKDKWEVIDKIKMSEETYKRRKRDLIYAVHNELNKLDNLQQKNKLT